jgi:predicted nucleic acid-binding protein
MFWDSSALVPLLVPEAPSVEITALLRRDRPVIWWTTVVECQSALQRRNREGAFQPAELDTALQRLDRFLAGCSTVAATDEVRRRAGRLLAVHPLRAADALQLGAALVFAAEEKGVGFVCLDRGLRLAASKEGFRVLPVNAAS